MTAQAPGPRLLALSAPTSAALERATDELSSHLDSLDDGAFARLPEVPDVPVAHGSLRRAVVARSAADMARRLRKRDPRRVFTGGPGTRAYRVFLFSGVGDQYPALGAGLHRSLPEFRRELDRCLELLATEHGLPLRSVLFPPAGPGDGHPGRAELFDRGGAGQEIHRTAVAQPLMFVLQYALAHALTSLGAGPSAVAGYSVGEFAAACVAGVFPLEDALRLVAERARLVDELPAGAMLAVMAGLPAVTPYVGGPVSLAALNGPEQTMLSGPVEAIEETAERLTADGVACRLLATTHAFHSAMTRPLTGPMEKLLATVRLRPPRLPVLSGVTGTWLREEEATSDAYWARQLSRTIRFADAVGELWRSGDPLLVELGPGQTLSRLALQSPDRPAHATASVVQTLPGRLESRTEPELLLCAAGQLWTAGAEIGWRRLHPGRRSGEAGDAAVRSVS